MPRRHFRYAWLITLIAGTALACNLISGIQNFQKARQTGAAVLDEVQQLATQNAPMIETARVLVTTEGGSLVKTAEAVITESGVLDTAQAYATQELPELRQTLQAAATDLPDLAETLGAVVTDQPGLLETMNAIATRFAGRFNGSDEVPEDIPLVDQETIQDLNVIAGLITYSTSLDVESVVDFYQTEMPANGWDANEDTSMITGSTALLTYDKVDRTATLIITGDVSSDEVSVVIQVSPK
jgi:hypothetical protein